MFFDEILPHDYDLVCNFCDQRPIQRMADLIAKLGLNDIECKTKMGNYLLNCCKQESRAGVWKYQESVFKQ